MGLMKKVATAFGYKDANSKGKISIRTSSVTEIKTATWSSSRRGICDQESDLPDDLQLALFSNNSTEYSPSSNEAVQWPPHTSADGRFGSLMALSLQGMPGMAGLLNSPGASVNGTPSGPTCTGGGHGEAPPSTAGHSARLCPPPVRQYSSCNVQALLSPACNATATPLARHVAKRSLRKVTDSAPISLPSIGIGSGGTRQRGTPPFLTIQVPGGGTGADAGSTGGGVLSPQPPSSRPPPPVGPGSIHTCSPRVRRSTTLETHIEYDSCSIGADYISVSCADVHLSAATVAAESAGRRDPPSAVSRERFSRVASMKIVDASCVTRDNVHDVSSGEEAACDDSPTSTVGAPLQTACPYGSPRYMSSHSGVAANQTADAVLGAFSSSSYRNAVMPSGSGRAAAATTTTLPRQHVSSQLPIRQLQMTPKQQQHNAHNLHPMPPDTSLPKLRSVNIFDSMSTPLTMSEPVAMVAATETQMDPAESGGGGSSSSSGGAGGGVGHALHRTRSIRNVDTVSLQPSPASYVNAKCSRSTKTFSFGGVSGRTSGLPTAASQCAYPPPPAQSPSAATAAAAEDDTADEMVIVTEDELDAVRGTALVVDVELDRLTQPLRPKVQAWDCSLAPRTPLSHNQPSPNHQRNHHQYQNPQQPSSTQHQEKLQLQESEMRSPPEERSEGFPATCPAACCDPMEAWDMVAATAAAAAAETVQVNSFTSPPVCVRPSLVGRLTSSQSPSLEEFTPRPTPGQGLVFTAPTAAPTQTLRVRESWAVADYKILRKLYAGYASSVYKAACKHSGTDVVLKAYHLTSLSPFLKNQVLRELDVHCRLRHPHIVQLLAAFRDGDLLLLVLEYVRGGSLGRVRRKLGGRLSEFQSMHLVLLPLLGVLRHLHERGIVHRDIKPENLLFTEGWQLKLCDFGVSICLREERAVTRTGSREYMAPEVNVCPLKRGPEDNKNNVNLAYSAAVDVWSLGSLMYELLVGFTPFPGGPPQRKDGARGSAGQGLAFPSSVSPGARVFVRDCLQLDPADRPTVQQLLEHDWVKEARLAGS